MPIQKWSDKIWVAQLAGHASIGEDIDLLQRHAMTTDAMPDVVVDMSGVEHINSSHLSHLLRLRKCLIDADARLRLTAPNDRIWAVFLATGLDKVFEFTHDTGTALAQLQIER